jgi:hypothetical protein
MPEGLAAEGEGLGVLLHRAFLSSGRRGDHRLVDSLYYACRSARRPPMAEPTEVNSQVTDLVVDDDKTRSGDAGPESARPATPGSAGADAGAQRKGPAGDDAG